MQADKDDSGRFAALRRRAEALLGEPGKDAPELSPEEVRELVYDLQTHQIELQMQNEELLRTQVELHEACEQYTDLYDYAPVGYLTISEKGLIVQANLTAAGMLRVDRPWLIKRPLSNFLLDGDQDTWYLHRRRLLDTRRPQTCEVRLRAGCDESGWVAMESSLVGPSDDKPLEIRTVLSDITPRKRMETELQQAHDELECRVEARTAALTASHEQLRREVEQREQAHESLQRSQRLASIGTLAAGIAHEVNNPLHGILLSAGVAAKLEDREAGKETLDKMLRIIQEQATHCGQIVKGILQFAREEETDKWPDRLDRVVRRAVDLTRQAAEQRKVVLRVDLPHGLPDVVINPTEMQQVFANLIGNAIEASEPGDGVEVRLTHDDDTVCAQVEDRGCGMSREQIEHVFDPFFTTKKHDGGTGLGLSVVHGIVEQHRGTITVESTRGEGTVFTLVLPNQTSIAEE